MAQAFHSHFVKDNPAKLPENFRPWDKLPKTYQTANLEQAGYAMEILQSAGFDVRPIKSPSAHSFQFTSEEIERMAELEHGRWNVERLRDGWRFGTPRDNEKKIHDCIVPWEILPDKIREYDRQAIRVFPEILAKAGLEIFR